MPKTIAIIDDEPLHISPLIRGLELAGYRTIIYKSTELVKDILKMSSPPADFFIVDLMMPHMGAYSDTLTDNGLYTGLFIARDIRDKWPHHPILLWSQTPFRNVKNAAAQFSKGIPHCAFCHKQSLELTKLNEIVGSYFKAGKFKRSIASTLWDAISINPKIGGVGIDVKKLINK